MAGMPNDAKERFLTHHDQNPAYASNLMYLGFVPAAKRDGKENVCGPTHAKFGMRAQLMIHFAENKTMLVELWKSKRFEELLPDGIGPYTSPKDPAAAENMQLHWTHGTPA